MIICLQKGSGCITRAIAGLEKKSQSHLTTFEQLIIQPFMAEVIEFGIEVLVCKFPFGKL